MRPLAVGVAAATICTVGMTATGSASQFVHAAGFAGGKKKGNISVAFVFCFASAVCM